MPTPAVRIAVAGAGQIGKRHIELIVKSAECALSAIVDPAPAAADYARTLGVPIYGSLAELFAQGPPRRRGPRDAESAARRPGARMHRRQSAHAGRKARGAHARSRHEAVRGGRSGERARAGRPPPPPQLDHGQGRRGHRERDAREDRRRRGHRALLQGRERGLLRRRVRVAARTRRRSHPAQHDSRGRQPALAVRRNRGRAGVHVERHAKFSGRGYGGHRVALRQRRARHLHAVGHRGLGSKLGAHVRRGPALREGAHRRG